MRPSPVLLSTSILLVALSANARAQIHQDWLNTLNPAPTGSDYINAVALSASGNVYAVGHTGLDDVLLAKFDAAGNLAWSRTFDYAGGRDTGSALVLEPGTESVYVLGRCDSTTSNGLVQKYDAAGTLLWTSVFNPPNSSAQFYTGCLTPAGDLLAAAGLGAGGFEVLAFDPQGNVLWNAFDATGDYPSSIAIDTNGDILISGSYYGTGANEMFGVSRFSSSGAFLWRRRISAGGEGEETAARVVVDGQGSAYATGRLIDPTVGPEEALVKLDSNGNVLWTATLQGSAANSPVGYEWLDPLAFAPNGNIRAAGLCSNSGAGTDLRLVEYTPAGQLVWQSTWNGPASSIELCLNFAIGLDGTQTILAGTESTPGSFSPAVVRWDAHGAFVGADIDDLSALGSTNIWFAAFGRGGTHVFSGRTPNFAPSDALVLQVREQSLSFCFGDGSSIACPCANGSATGEGRGCTNSIGDSARLTSSGVASLTADALSLTSAGELPSAPSLFLQGSVSGAGAALGDGILCLSGSLQRMFTHAAAGGVASAPSGSDASFSARSAALGDPISAGSHRYYQVVYRDPSGSFCPPPSGSTANLSSALSVLWVP